MHAHPAHVFFPVSPKSRHWGCSSQLPWPGTGLRDLILPPTDLSPGHSCYFFLPVPSYCCVCILAAPAKEKVAFNSLIPFFNKDFFFFSSNTYKLRVNLQNNTSTIEIASAACEFIETPFFQ